MINISLDLSNKLPAEQVNIIRQVVHAAESQGLRLFIVGAQARDLLLQYAYDLPAHRATNDGRPAMMKIDVKNCKRNCSCDGCNLLKN
jgi:predicted nucleotidyltransferase